MESKEHHAAIKTPRLQVLTRRSDFLFLLKHGQRVRASDWLLLNFIRHSETSSTESKKIREQENPNRERRELNALAPSMRCGFTLPRQVGGAVIRNKLRRWSRAYFRSLLKSGGSLPIDVNLVFRKAPEDFYKKLKYDTFSEVLDQAWNQVERRLKSPTSTGYRPVQKRGGSSSRRSVPV